MKIDLHCHTKKIKKGDDETRNVSAEMFKEKIIAANVEIVAITNHNHFDLAQYENFRDVVSGFCQVWPGVELDMKGVQGKDWHLVVVVNPDNAADLNRIVKELMKDKNVDTVRFDRGPTVQAFKDVPLFFIPHYHKSNRISDPDFEDFCTLVGDSNKVIKEASNINSLHILQNKKERGLMGSDVSDWQTYEKCGFSELRLRVDSFQQFDLFVRRDSTMVNTLMNSTRSYRVEAKPHKSVKINLSLYNEINVIFGQKGTGKSEILASIRTDLEGKKGLTCSVYAGKERDSSFKEFETVKKEMRSLKNRSIDPCIECFSALCNWTDVQPELFSKYFDFARGSGNSGRKRMKILNTADMKNDDIRRYRLAKDDHGNLKVGIESIRKIKLNDYIEDDDIFVLKSTLETLAKKIAERKNTSSIGVQSTQLTNKAATVLKKTMDIHTNGVSKPSSTGFVEFARNRLEVKRCCHTIVKNMKMQISPDQDLIGSLDEKGNIYTRTEYQMYRDGSPKSCFESKVRLQDLKKVTDALKKLYANAFSAEVSNEISELKNACDEGNHYSLEKFLGVTRTIVTEDNKPYAPSEGEKGILLLQHILSKDADAYIMDEPELGMGNSYIEMSIRPLLEKLGKSGKCVVVATHNANLAVRTLPYSSIYRTHANGVYKTYVGNPFSNLLINIDDATDHLNWRDESLKTLEGGDEAFYGRSRVYEDNQYSSATGDN